MYLHMNGTNNPIFLWNIPKSSSKIKNYVHNLVLIAFFLFIFFQNKLKIIFILAQLQFKCKWSEVHICLKKMFKVKNTYCYTLSMHFITILGTVPMTYSFFWQILIKVLNSSFPKICNNAKSRIYLKFRNISNDTLKNSRISKNYTKITQKQIIQIFKQSCWEAENEENSVNRTDSGRLRDVCLCLVTGRFLCPLSQHPTP